MGRGWGVALVALVGGAVAREGRAAVMVDGSLQASASNSDLLDSPNLTVGNGSQRMLVVGVAIANPVVTVASLTWKGVSLSRVDAQTVSGPAGACRQEVWALVGAAPGNNMLHLALSGMTAFGLGAVAYTGVDPKAPLGKPIWLSGMNGPVALDVSTTDARPVLGAACL